jgi:gluconokinase
MSTLVNDIAKCPDAESDIAIRSQDSRMPFLVALDIGSSGVRAALFDENGCAISGAEIQESYGDITRDLATFDAEALLERVTQTIDGLFCMAAASSARIELIAVSCFWHSLLGVDQSGAAITPVFSWADQRAADATFELREEFDESVTHARTGCRFHPSYWPSKLRRLRNEEPHLVSRTRRWLSFADYMLSQLFGVTTTSSSIASGSGLFNLANGDWDEELVAAVGIGRENLPEISEQLSTRSSGRADYVSRWPQLRDARVCPATGDGATNSTGAGCHSKEKIALMIGTSGAMRVSFTGDPPVRLPPELWCYRANHERIVIGGALSDGGGLIRFLKETFSADGSMNERELETLAPDAHGLTILPFWAGERSTAWNPRTRGAMFGLSGNTTPVEIVRAAMEAIGYRFALIFSKLQEFAPDGEVVVSGNALRQSPLWIQILADVLGQRLALPKVAEASTQGAALLALEAAGKIQSIEKFSVPIEAVFEPNMTHHAIYREGLERQQKLYEKLYGNFGVR